ncbi:5,10-methylenetetrahydrofolate reductase [Chitinophaga sp. CF118]|uniref:methylenetetrahydrofolate reductase n=1 Tax=Chitinophaga sp. CF118 TaxID=1884367 RepID=UPI0008F34814|nr:methylenetetrahydrofolate reductase [Chitinophaga sp. CF118]SFD63152.1 5,10-methylenetetrahydrofolate reductase [Chitinophaga sp. CF118]
MNSSLRSKILEGNAGLVFYSLTPPKITTEEAKVLTIANNQIERLKNLNIDALILYDIQDETLRTEKERTFSFIPTITPELYGRNFISELSIPKIIYKSIANQTREEFENWLKQNEDLEYTVFVGASSHQQIEATNFSLSDAYNLKKKYSPNTLLGGITIPERHSKKKDEHLRIFNKIEYGCSFFVSQCVYNINDTKNLLSDYFYNSLERECNIAPIIFTLAPCGSLKTLQFMEWLGIEVPGWLYNDLKHSKDILEASINTSTNIAIEILNYANKKNIPVGFNVESISIKKEEINAAQEILNNILNLLKPGKQLL